MPGNPFGSCSWGETLRQSGCDRITPTLREAALRLRVAPVALCRGTRPPLRAYRPPLRAYRLQRTAPQDHRTPPPQLPRLYKQSLPTQAIKFYFSCY